MFPICMAWQLSPHVTAFCIWSELHTQVMNLKQHSASNPWVINLQLCSASLLTYDYVCVPDSAYLHACSANNCVPKSGYENSCTEFLICCILEYLHSWISIPANFKFQHPPFYFWNRQHCSLLTKLPPCLLYSCQCVFQLINLHQAFTQDKHCKDS